MRTKKPVPSTIKRIMRSQRILETVGRTMHRKVMRGKPTEWDKGYAEGVLQSCTLTCIELDRCIEDCKRP